MPAHPCASPSLFTVFPGHTNLGTTGRPHPSLLKNPGFSVHPSSCFANRFFTTFCSCCPRSCSSAAFLPSGVRWRHRSPLSRCSVCVSYYVTTNTARGVCRGSSRRQSHCPTRPRACIWVVGRGGTRWPSQEKRMTRDLAPCLQPRSPRAKGLCPSPPLLCCGSCNELFSL